MQLIYHENPSFNDAVHEDDLQYMLKNTYTNTSFFLQTITKDGSTYTFWGDVQKKLYFVSDNMRDRFGFKRNKVEDLPRKWVDRIYNPIDKRRYQLDVENMIRDKKQAFDERYMVQDCDDHIFWVHCYGQIEWSEDKTTPLFFCGKINAQDMSLITDPVTSFAGESIIMNHLKMIEKYNRHCSCIGFSLNHVQKINSIQGRTYGKRMMQDVAHELVRRCNKMVTFYRLDTTYFIAILSTSAGIPYEQCIEEIREIIQETYRKMGFPEQDSCSFAVMQFPKANHTVIDFLGDMVTLIDLAMKETDVPYLDEHSEAVYQLQKQTELEFLIKKNVTDGMIDFRPVVQPVISTKTGKIIGGETLMRWKDADRDISPAIFIPILENSSMIHMAGMWIFEHAVQICKEITRSLPDFYLNVNVSVRQLDHPDFYDFIPAVLKKYDLDGKHIVIEVTESCLAEEPEHIRKLLEVCQSCGIRLALDDFGTGYSSMHVLLEYPLHVVKIDRSLLLEMSESADKYNFISSIVYACHQFGKTVCIEGVENKRQRDLSDKAGCDLIQGFYYYRPLELDQLKKVIEEQTANL